VISFLIDSEECGGQHGVEAVLRRPDEVPAVMTKPDPQSPPKVTPETVGRLSAEVVGTPVDEKYRKAVAEMLQALAADLAALRRLDVGAAEPAFVFDPAEADS
jgi:hypothetical protein